MKLKQIAFLLLNFFLCRQINAQDTLVRSNHQQLKYEFSMLFGYNTPVGFWGAEFAYRPNVLSRIFQPTVSIGVAIPEGMKFSAGINILPFKERRLTPFCGGSYTFVAGQWMPSENSTESVTIGRHNYLNPYSGLKLNSSNRRANLKLILGYSFLLGKPNVTVTPGPISSGNNYYDYYVKRVSSDYFVAFGIGCTL